MTINLLNDRVNSKNNYDNFLSNTLLFSQQIKRSLYVRCTTKHLGSRMKCKNRVKKSVHSKTQMKNESSPIKVNIVGQDLLRAFCTLFSYVLVIQEEISENKLCSKDFSSNLRDIFMLK